jgi:YVTN family beta-propeller protein
MGTRHFLRGGMNIINNPINMKSILILVVSVIFLPFASTALAEPYAYITSGNSKDVSVIDSLTNEIVAKIPVGNFPVGVAVNSSGTMVYVVNRDSNNISVIDTETNAVIATVDVGNFPHGIAVNPLGTRGYVTNIFSDNVSVIDTLTNTNIATVPVGDGPVAVAVNSSGTRVYASNQNSNSVSVIDANTNTIIATIPVGSMPHGIALNPSGTRAYVANYNSDSVCVIDTSKNKVIYSVWIQLLNNGLYGITINPSGTKTYVTHFLTNKVSVINTSTNTVVKTIALDFYPLGIDVSPDGSKVYVAHYYQQTVSVIDATTDSVVSTIPVVSLPIAFGQFFKHDLVPPESIDNDNDGYTEMDGDCNDSDADEYPGQIWYRDLDGDGYGDPSTSLSQCLIPINYVIDNTDIDDGVPNTRAGSAAWYLSIQDAYNASGDGYTIEIQSEIFTEDLMLDHYKTVTLQGGYNTDFDAILGDTILNGSITIVNGMISIENLILR